MLCHLAQKKNGLHTPFEANIINGELIGRGAADMKGSVAAFVQSVKNFLSDNSTPNFQIWIMLTSNEEGEPADGKINTLMDSLPSKINLLITAWLVKQAHLIMLEMS